MTYRITIPNWRPFDLNRVIGRHWSVVHKLKRIDRNLIGIYGLGVPKAKVKRRVRLVLTLGPRQRGPDPDASWKGLLDSLVALGLLVDDSRKWCELVPVEYLRGERKSTTIELTDLEDPSSTP